MCDMIFIICRLPLIVVYRNTDVSVILTNKSQPGNNVLHPTNVRSFALKSWRTGVTRRVAILSCHNTHDVTSIEFFAFFKALLFENAASNTFFFAESGYSHHILSEKTTISKH